MQTLHNSNSLEHRPSVDYEFERQMIALYSHDRVGHILDRNLFVILFNDKILLLTLITLVGGVDLCTASRPWKQSTKTQINTCWLCGDIWDGCGCNPETHTSCDWQTQGSLLYLSLLTKPIQTYTQLIPNTSLLRVFLQWITQTPVRAAFRS
jgi:hypothetical protein